FRKSGTEEKEDSRKQNKTMKILNKLIEDYLEELELYKDWIVNLRKKREKQQAL
ncbi:3183_t:CDS:1, partial [Ambispora leptoticha]